MATPRVTCPHCGCEKAKERPFHGAATRTENMTWVVESKPRYARHNEDTLLVARGMVATAFAC